MTSCSRYVGESGVGAKRTYVSSNKRESTRGRVPIARQLRPKQVGIDASSVPGAASLSHWSRLPAAARRSEYAALTWSWPPFWCTVKGYARDIKWKHCDVQAELLAIVLAQHKLRSLLSSAVISTDCLSGYSSLTTPNQLSNAFLLSSNHLYASFV